MSDIKGSKPRKLIKKTNSSNPSLLSTNILSLWSPERFKNIQNKQINGQILSVQSNQIKVIRRNKSQYMNNPDSLKRAQQDFLKKKLSNPQIQQLRAPSKLSETYLKNTQYRSAIGISNLSYLKEFNYINFNSIKSKQRHGYDIINCMPQMTK